MFRILLVPVLFFALTSCHHYEGASNPYKDAKTHPSDVLRKDYVKATKRQKKDFVKTQKQNKKKIYGSKK